MKQELPFIYKPSSESSILRALLVFYPTDQDQTFQPEFRWLYRSWTEMMTYESSLWRTDLIVYANEYVSLFKDLDCTYDQIRNDSKEKPKCRVFPYIRIKDRQSKHEPSSKYQFIDNQNSKLLHEHLRTYGYIDSINTVFEYYLSFSMYDYILRTDMDCFLTHNFAHYVPYNNSLLVGRGGYSTAFNSKRLKRIAHNMNWTYADKNSLGSTWYGPSSMAHRLANYTLQAMLYLSINEFTTPEREQKLGVMLWPEWHYGVLLLYGGHLAINHLIASENFNIGLADQLLDQGVTSKDKTDIDKNLRLHLHCWHGDEPFSKFAFKAGKYNVIQPSSLISDTSASGYAMRIALESKLMTLEQLKQKLIDIKK
ncbi:unnamed protein product [Rotaria sp. Silwood1]|nr:unnamed protein product [Rotaria sp. Silwood1]CAF1097297.1 unnamed protein product [Rotaria sp. Silwood1]CAF3369787.1 unnamed protein product [Rotaria sp. Silwood1]CAF4665759.1 unnamed protein product [Rotaria sp. Silwood1]CAF4720305.1 unnamed protein product [Rotaria sp. Silwood1]